MQICIKLKNLRSEILFLKEAYLHLVKGYVEDVTVKADARLSKAEPKSQSVHHKLEMQQCSSVFTQI